MVDNLRIQMAPLNRPATKLPSKWSKLYQIVAVKGVVATMEDPEKMESLTVHVDRLALSSARLRDELAPEHFDSFYVPFRSLSNSSLHHLFGEGPVEPSRLPMPTPRHEAKPTFLHDPTPTPGS